MVKKMVDLSKVELCDVVENYLKSKKPQTAATYRGSLKRFRYWYGKDLTEFINEVESQREVNKSVPPSERRRQFDEKANEFITWAKGKGYANNPIRGSLTALQNFFKYYDVPISYSFVNLPPQTAKKSNGKHKWKIDEIKLFVNSAESYKDKAIILCMFQSGMAVNEICNLDYGDVANQLKSGELPLLIDKVRQKNDNRFKTLIGADAVKYLKLYLETRTGLNERSPLFLNERKRNGEERITDMAIQGRFRNLASKVFGVTEGEMNPYRPHSMRSAFRSRLTGKTDTDLIKFWMGDKLGAKAGAYLNLPDEEHRELYVAVEGRLSIETTSKEVLKGQSVEGEEPSLVRVYRDRISELEQKNFGLERSVDNLGEQVGKLSKINEQIIQRVLTLEDERNARVESMVEKIRGEILSKIESGEIKAKVE